MDPAWAWSEWRPQSGVSLPSMHGQPLFSFTDLSEVARPSE